MTATAEVKLAPIGFNGVYTLENAETGEHRTFSIKTQRDGRWAEGERVVALLTGPDNENDYQSFGFVKHWGILVWNKKRGTRENPSAFDHYAAMLKTAMDTLAGDGEILDGEIGYKGRRYNVRLAKRCLRCNKLLNTPESIARGYGPECASKLGII